MAPNIYREPPPHEPDGASVHDEGESWFQPVLHAAILLTLMAAVAGRFLDTHTVDAQSSVALLVAVMVALLLVSEVRAAVRGARDERHGA
jgi:hypothetical protein